MEAVELRLRLTVHQLPLINGLYVGQELVQAAIWVSNGTTLSC